ncbi:MAG: hypothetical protein LBK22_11070, partial [Tannerella sp.]|nr:hypothetical protein [Tannerella sp.]
MTAPVGYGRNTVGGAGGAVVTVNSHSALKTALKAAGKSVIVITQNIEFTEGNVIGEKVNDKTMLGLPGVKLISNAQVKNGGILELKSGSSNVIIRNLIFEGPGAYDVDGRDLLTNNGCIGLWVDHCEFYDGVDGNFDNSNTADNITVSWCKFGYRKAPKAGGSGGSADHRFSNLIGGSDSTYPADGRYSITFHYCYWSDGCKDRMPRARNAEIHLLNCYYNVDVSNANALGFSAGDKGLDCYVENCHFKKINTVCKTNYGGSPSVTFSGCNAGSKSYSNAGSLVGKPAYPCTALDVSDVEAAVTAACGAGATLQVTANGEVTSGGQPLSVADAPSPGEWRLQQSPNELTICGIQVEEMTLYNLFGGRVRHVAGSQNMNVPALNSGFYILSI